MQEGFALRAKKAVKKVAAFGAGLTMVGATLSGAFAAGTLADYPAPFVSSGRFVDVALVVGKNAKSEDNLALTDISGKLSTVAAGGTSTTGTQAVSGGTTADIPLGKSLSSTSGNEFDTILQHDDVPNFFDGTISWRSTDYDTSEVLVFNMNQTISPQTSLTSSDDDYESGVFLEAERNSIRYYYSFDERINLTDSGGVTSDYPVEIQFLGKPFKVTSLDIPNGKITATVGDEYFMKVDDTVTANGHTVTLMNVGSTGTVQVKVDDSVETISSGNTKTFGGETNKLEIKNTETFYDANDLTQRSATLVMGEEAAQTFKNGDEYPGYKDQWIWNIGNIGGTTTVVNNATGLTDTGFILGVTNDFAKNDASDNPPGVGECYNLPNNYASICLDGLSVPDSSYMELTVEALTNGVDFTKAGYPSLTTEPAIYIHVDKSEGLVVDQNLFNFSNGSVSTAKTDKIWLYTAGTGSDSITQVYYNDNNGVMTLAGNVTGRLSGMKPKQFAHLDYGDVSSSDMILTVLNNVTGGGDLNITIVPYDGTDLTTYNDNITLQFKTVSGKINSLGATASSEEGSEIVWNQGTGVASKALGTKDEDHRNKYGIVIRDPKSHGSSDKEVLEIPSDIVLADVSATSSHVATGPSTPSTTQEAPSAMLDSELTNPSQYNVITVGGPCVNAVTANLLGLAPQTCGSASGIAENTAIIELKQQTTGGHWAMIVAGWEAEDTRRAGIVLKNYPSFFASTTGTSVTVKGTGVAVSGITVE